MKTIIEENELIVGEIKFIRNIASGDENNFITGDDNYAGCGHADCSNDGCPCDRGGQD